MLISHGWGGVAFFSIKSRQLVLQAALFNLLKKVFLEKISNVLQRAEVCHWKSGPVRVTKGADAIENCVKIYIIEN